MICDAHVHVGYWRCGDKLRYYSPRRVVGVLDRCGVDQFIVSSTSPQAGAIATRDLIREAKEIRRLAGARAHIYCWVTGAMYRRDPALRILSGDVYDGIKLHERETPWNAARKETLCRILEIAEARHLNVMFHCGRYGACTPTALKWVAGKYSGIKFNFAHCCPVEEVLQVMRECENVYSDVSCLPFRDVVKICKSEVADRIMFGSDFPALCADPRLTPFYRKSASEIGALGLWLKFTKAFEKFVTNKGGC